jgi:hypothetical protein
MKYIKKTLDANTTQFLRDSLREAKKLKAKLVSITDINEKAIKKMVEAE